MYYSSPAIGSDGTLYVGSMDGRLYAVNPDGTQKWVFTTGDIIYSSPAISSDGTIYVGSDDNKLYAVNPDGGQKWAFTTVDPIEDVYTGRIQSSPAIGSDGTIYVSCMGIGCVAIGKASPSYLIYIIGAAFGVLVLILVLRNVGKKARSRRERLEKEKGEMIRMIDDKNDR